MICTELQVVFVHIYKTAGSSLTKLLAPYADLGLLNSFPRLSGDGWQSTWHYKGAQHSRLEPDFSELLKMGHVHEASTVLSVVRNPYSWQHSIWARFYATEGVLESSKWFGYRYPERSFLQYLQFIQTASSEDTPAIWGSVPLASFLKSLDGVDRTLTVDFDTFSSDVTRSLRTIGLDVNRVPHLNRKPYATSVGHSFSDEAVEIINRVFWQDFEEFNFPILDSASEVVKRLRS